jgi:hypothetical protein
VTVADTIAKNICTLLVARGVSGTIDAPGRPSVYSFRSEMAAIVECELTRLTDGEAAKP